MHDIHQEQQLLFLESQTRWRRHAIDSPWGSEGNGILSVWAKYQRKQVYHLESTANQCILHHGKIEGDVLCYWQPWICVAWHDLDAVVDSDWCLQQDGWCEQCQLWVRWFRVIRCSGGVRYVFAKVWVLTGPEWLHNTSSFWKYTLKLFVEATASTWHVVWYIFQLNLLAIITIWDCWCSWSWKLKNQMGGEVWELSVYEVTEWPIYR